MAITRPLRRGDVCLIRLDPARGSEIRKTRPCLVVSPDELNQHLRTFIVAPMTTGFRQWQKDLQVDPSVFGNYQFETKFGEVPTGQIEFGGYKGRPRWDTALQIPDQRIRDSLLHLIVYQGDTEFASSEQQRNLLQNPPSRHDLQCAARVMREEMRHGWQMAYLLVFIC